MSTPSSRSSHSAGAPAEPLAGSQSKIENRRSKTFPAWLAGLVLVAAILLAYQPAWNAGFIWDDDDYVTHNPLITEPDGWSRIWFSTDAPSQYFPLVYSTFRVEHALWGFNATGYHWVNLLVHAANALLLWRLLVRLSIPGAWFGAAFFALHPINVESAAWITQLKNTQSLFFCLLALHAWVAFVAPDGRRAWWCYALALLCQALALFSKTTACTLPAALLLVVWVKHWPVTRARLLQLVPFLLAGVAMGYVSMWWEKHHQGTVGELYSMGLLDRLLVATRAVWFYLGKVGWPADLTFNYPLWKIDAADPRAYAGLVAGLVLIAGVLWARRRGGRALETAVVWFVAMLSPLLGFIMLYTFRYTYVADHYAYVASIGPLVLLAAGLATLAARRPSWARALHGGAVVLVAALAVATWRQSRMYENLETLWATTIARNPTSYMGHNNLAAIRVEQGRLDEAVTLLERALEILPDHRNALGNLATARLRQGRIDEAAALLQRVIAQDPADPNAHRDLALIAVHRGDGARAVEHARRALATRPDDADALNNLGAGLVLRGEAEAALAPLERAVRARGNFADALFNLGTAYLQAGRLEGAIDRLREAVAARPNFAKAHANLGHALLRDGQVGAALESFQAAHTLAPAALEFRSALAAALWQAGRADEALAQLEHVAQHASQSARAQFELATAFLQLGRPADALPRLHAAIAAQADFSPAHQALALVLAERGERAAAQVAARRALELQQSRPDPAWVPELAGPVAALARGESLVPTAGGPGEGGAR